MPFLDTDVTVKQIDDEHFELLAPVRYKGNDEMFTVPAGFKTDFASVPKIFTWLIPRYGAYTKAAILHDYLCETTVVGRADADGLFRRTMRELGVPFLRRWIMWAAVRIGAHLKGTTPSELAIFLLLAVPSIVFFLIPVGVLLVWMILFYVLEVGVFGLLKPFSKKQVNWPKMFVQDNDPPKPQP